MRQTGSNGAVELACGDHGHSRPHAASRTARRQRQTRSTGARSRPSSLLLRCGTHVWTCANRRVRKRPACRNNASSRHPCGGLRQRPFTAGFDWL